MFDFKHEKLQNYHFRSFPAYYMDMKWKRKALVAMARRIRKRREWKDIHHNKIWIISERNSKITSLSLAAHIKMKKTILYGRFILWSFFYSDHLRLLPIHVHCTKIYNHKFFTISWKNVCGEWRRERNRKSIAWHTSQMWRWENS